MTGLPDPTSAQYMLLGVAGLCAGGLNAVAGGGGFITLPVLLYCGLPPVMANVSGSLAVWPGSLAGLYAYRQELRGKGHPLVLCAVIGALGGLAGGLLLMVSRNDVFMLVLPYLLLLATVLFAFGERITALVLKTSGGKRVPQAAVVSLLMVIALYGGYFGGGMGIMTLAVLALMGMTDIHEMNALKTYLVAIINGTCNLVFVIVGLVAWQQCLVMMLGCIIGGYLASRWARTINRTVMRALVLCVASSLTIYFLVRAWMPA